MPPAERETLRDLLRPIGTTVGRKDGVAETDLVVLHFDEKTR